MSRFKLYILPTERISESISHMVDSMIRAEVCYKAIMCFAVERIYSGPIDIPYDDLLIGYDRKSDYEVDFGILESAIKYAEVRINPIVSNLGLMDLLPTSIDVDCFGDVLITTTAY